MSADLFSLLCGEPPRFVPPDIIGSLPHPEEDLMLAPTDSAHSVAPAEPDAPPTLREAIRHIRALRPGDRHATLCNLLVDAVEAQQLEIAELRAGAAQAPAALSAAALASIGRLSDPT